MKIADTESMSGADLARVFGISRPAINKWLRKGCPRDPDTRRFNLRAVIKWRYQQIQAEADPMETAEGKSPALERYRIAKAKTAEIELEIKRGSLVDVETVQGHLMAISERLKQAGEQLERQYGRDALDILNEALIDYERRLKAIEKKRRK